MPQRSKLSVNKSLLSKKGRDNLIGNVVLLSIFAGVVGGGGYLIFDSVDDSNDHAIQEDIRQDVIASGKGTIDGLDFSLEDYHQVEHTHGNHAYTFDFHTQIVTLNGPDGSDIVMTFSEFPNQEFIEQARQAGLAISREFEQRLDASLSEEEKAWLAEEGPRQNTANGWIIYQRNFSNAFLEKNGEEVPQASIGLGTP